MVIGTEDRGYLLKDIGHCLVMQVYMIDFHLRYFFYLIRCHSWQRGTAPLQIFEEHYKLMSLEISCQIHCADNGLLKLKQRFGATTLISPISIVGFVGGCLSFLSAISCKMV